MCEDQGHRNCQFSLQQYYFNFSITCVGFQVMEVRGQKFRGQGHFKVTEVSTFICLAWFQWAMSKDLLRRW